MKRSLNKYPKGGPIKPIIVTNPDDPRLKAYNDSLSKYNFTLEEIKRFTPTRTIPYKKGTFKEKVEPINYLTDDDETIIVANYKKPVQEVIYQPIKKAEVKNNRVETLYDSTPTLTVPEREVTPTVNKNKTNDNTQSFKQGRKFMRETGKRPGWYKDGGTTGTNAAVSSVSNLVPGAQVAVPLLQIGDQMTTDKYGAPESGIKGIYNRTNPLANIRRISEGKDVGRSLVGLTGVGTLAEATGLNKKIFGESVYDKEAKDRTFQEENFKNYNRMNTTANWGNPSIATSNNMIFDEGGMVIRNNQPNANAELELQETAQLPNGEVFNVDAPSHENGGIALNLPEGTRIWSDRLKYNGKTFANHTKPITNKIAKLEDKIVVGDANSKVKENTVMLLNKQLDHFFNIQETNKQNNEMKKSFRKGGVVKYANGGTNPYDPFNQSDLYNKWENANQSVVRNNNSTYYTPEKSKFSTPYDMEYQTKNMPISPFGTSDEADEEETPEKKSWLAENSGQIGQVGSSLLSAGIQSRRINKLAKPRTLSNVRLADKVVNPSLVDYSAERNAIDRVSLTSMDEAQKGFGSSAATQAFKNKARLNALEGTGRSFQNQSNVNTQIKNAANMARQEAAMKEAMINNEIEKYNLENVYGFDTMKVGQKNAITASLANTAGQVFGNQTTYKNQLEAANILANQYDPSVINDMIKNGSLKYENGKLVKARYGGTMKKRSFRK